MNLYRCSVQGKYKNSPSSISHFSAIPWRKNLPSHIFYSSPKKRKKKKYIVPTSYTLVKDLYTRTCLHLPCPIFTLECLLSRSYFWIYQIYYQSSMLVFLIDALFLIILMFFWVHLKEGDLRCSAIPKTFLKTRYTPKKK